MVREALKQDGGILEQLKSRMVIEPFALYKLNNWLRHHGKKIERSFPETEIAHRGILITCEDIESFEHRGV